MPRALAVLLLLAACSPRTTGDPAEWWSLAESPGMELCREALKAHTTSDCHMAVPGGRMLVRADSAGRPQGFVRYRLGGRTESEALLGRLRDSLVGRLGPAWCTDAGVIWQRDGRELRLELRRPGEIPASTDSSLWAVATAVGPARDIGTPRPCT